MVQHLCPTEVSGSQRKVALGAGQRKNFREPDRSSGEEPKVKEVGLGKIWVKEEWLVMSV